MSKTIPIRTVSRTAATLLASGSVLLLSGCVAPTAMGEPAASAPPPPRVFFYPTQGQSTEQQDRDRYECHQWAVQQTGFDPSRRPLSESERNATVPARETGQAAAAGAVVGAVIGAIAAPRGDAAKGAIVGAAAGGLLGAAGAEAEAAEASRASARRDMVQGRRNAAEYRRAMSACLEGRGYSVR